MLRYVWSALSVSARLLTVFAWLLVLALVLSIATPAHAQGVPPTINPGETYTLTWVQDPFCADGTTPITQCPVTGYRIQIEREQSMNIWNDVSPAPLPASARTWTWTANGVGVTSFRVQGLNPAGYPTGEFSNIKVVRVLPPPKQASKPPALSSSKD